MPKASSWMKKARKLFCANIGGEQLASQMRSWNGESVKGCVVWCGCCWIYIFFYFFFCSVGNVKNYRRSTHEWGNSSTNDTSKPLVYFLCVVRKVMMNAKKKGGRWKEKDYNKSHSFSDRYRFVKKKKKKKVNWLYLMQLITMNS